MHQSTLIYFDGFIRSFMFSLLTYSGIGNRDILHAERQANSYSLGGIRYLHFLAFYMMHNQTPVVVDLLTLAQPRGLQNCHPHVLWRYFFAVWRTGFQPRELYVYIGLCIYVYVASSGYYPSGWSWGFYVQRDRATPSTTVSTTIRATEVWAAIALGVSSEQWGRKPRLERRKRAGYTRCCRGTARHQKPRLRAP